MVSRFVVYSPKLSYFSGTGDSKDTPYEVWKFEVMNLLLEVREGHYSEQEVTTAVKKSLRAEAGKVAMRLGVHASVNEILTKFEGIYGTVEDSECLLVQFYNAKQGEEDSVSHWGCRLEDLLDRAQQTTHLDPRSKNDMLRSKFWSGLVTPLKESSRHKFDVVQDFDQLRIQVRKIENESKTNTEPKDKPKKGQAKMASVELNNNKSELDELKGIVKSLSTKMNEFLEPQKGTNVNQTRGRGAGRSRFPHSGRYNTYRSGRGRSYNQHYNQHNAYQGGPTWPKQWYGQQSGGEFVPGAVPSCWRCGQPGHLKIGCRTKLSGEGKNLNSRGPTQEGPQ